jgi:hypothetical protein
MRVESIRKATLAERRAGLIAPKAIPLFRNFVMNEFLPWDK